MADLPRPKKNKPVNTDADETVVINVDKAQYKKQNLDNVNTAKIPVTDRRIEYANNNNNNYNNNYNSNPSGYTGPRASSPQNRGYNNNGQNRNSYGQQNPNRTSGSNGYRNNGNNGYSQNRGTPQQRRYSGQSQQRPTQRPPQQRQNNNQRPAQQRNNAPRRKKSSTGAKVLKGILIAVITIFVLYSIIVLLCIFRMNHVSDGSRSRTASAMSSSKVTNVLIIGTDSRDPSVEQGRSDSMILLSLNSKTHKMYMSSFMRDAYVSIPGYGDNKLNAAYSYGGASLLMDTIEANYNVKIDSYISVTFAGFAGVIDSVGGVKVTLSDAEAEALNVILQSEVNELMGDDVNSDLIPSGGTYKLNGKQALSYSRIRHTGNADFERTERQRTVMTQVMSKIKTMNPVYITSLLGKSVPELTTNMSVGEMYLLSLRLPTLLLYSNEQQQIPADGTWSSATIDGQDVLQVDFDANEQLLEDTVFGS